MLEYIKSDKTLSLNHWRFKVIHWFFNVNPKTVDEAVIQCEMPRYFYTHFCPLFHISNLIVILFPLIVLFKILHFIIFKIIRAYRYLQDLRHTKKAAKESSKEFLLSQEYKWLKGFTDHNLNIDDFSKVWEQLNYYVTSICEEHDDVLITREAAEKFWTEYRERTLKTRAEQQEKQARRRRNIVFWVNLSRFIIKGFLNVVYLALTALVAYWTWSLRHIAWDMLVAVWSFDALATLLWIALWTLKLTLVGLVVGVLAWQVKLNDKTKRFFGVAHDIFSEMFNYMGQKIEDLKDFVSVFYDENCPEIHIVETEQGGEV